MSEIQRSGAFQPIPSIDLLGGGVVRLMRGDFEEVTHYAAPLDVVRSWNAPPGTRVHVVDLDGARSGSSLHHQIVRMIADLGYAVQVGGGIRSLDAARRWLDAGASRIVVGTVAAEDPATMRRIVEAAGPCRVIPAIDMADGRIRVRGWQEAASREARSILDDLAALGIGEILVTEIGRDGTMAGPHLDFYERMCSETPFRIQASGGVGTLGDVAALSRIKGLSGVVIGRALQDRRFTLREAREYSAAAGSIAHRVIPCLDVQDGRIVKGVRFASLRDAGDPVDAAIRYEAEGADELVILDITATAEGRATALETVRRVARSIFIPLTVGGGVGTLEDFRALLQSGADRVAINSAAVIRPALVEEAAREFGAQAVVLSCDAFRSAGKFIVATNAGTKRTELEAAAWCREAEGLGAGEILLTSIDRDGTRSGFDLDLLRSVTGAVRIGVIASGGAGSAGHMREAIDRGGARAVLAASLFHDGDLRIGEAKSFLARSGIAVRETEGMS